MHLTRRTVLGGMAATAFAPYARSAPRILRVETRSLDVKGRAASVYGIQGWQDMLLFYGDSFDFTVENAIAEDTLLHWHGLTPPSALDGVPHLSSKPIAPGQMKTFQFPLTRTGTHWMHSHVGLQEQKLLAAPLIVHEREKLNPDEQQHVVMLHDFTFREPAEILEELQKGGGAHAAHAGHDMSKMDMLNTEMSNMEMSGPMMVSDVTFDAMLANDRTLDDPEIVEVDAGGSLLLRIINGAAATNFWVDLGPLTGELVAVDGNAVFPVRGSKFPLAIAQRADIRIALPKDKASWAVLFQSEGSALRSGVILRVGDSAVAKTSDQGAPGELLTLDFEAGLKSVAELPDNPVSRTEMVMLTGGGADYVWGLNGKASMHDVLFTVREGERIDMMFHNMTGMAHPMHLHGHYFKVVNINGKAINGAIRDTVLVPPNAAVTVRFDADNPGTWAMHCHHLYHMNSGMMGAIAYKDAA
jgi:FtsP/CotA-like multicopper oxidase with cupredoxin domain